MKQAKKTSPGQLLAISFAGLGLLLSAEAFGQGASAPNPDAGAGGQRPCNNASVHGSYGFSEEGAVQFGTVPFRQVGVVKLDGKGGGNGTTQLNFAGHVTPMIPIVNVEYTVGENCMGEASFTVPATDGSGSLQTRTISFVVMRAGAEFHYMGTTLDGSWSRGVGKRQ